MTMHGSVEESFLRDVEYNRSEILHIGVFDFADAIEHALVFEVYRAWTNASKADDNMDDRKLAAWMRKEQKTQRWESPEVHPAHHYAHCWLGFDPPVTFTTAVRFRLQHITTDQVRRLREKCQQMVNESAARRAGLAWDMVWDTQAKLDQLKCHQ